MIDECIQSQIRASQILSPLAKAFETSLMEVDIEGVEDGNDEIENAIADAVYEYSLIGLSQRAIISRLIHHL